MNMNVPFQLLEQPQHQFARQFNEALEIEFSPQLRANYRREQGAMWLRWTPAPRPCFNPSLLRDLRSYCDMLDNSGGEVAVNGEMLPIEYSVLSSGAPGVFNLGGDLDLFVSLIDRRDRDGLLLYGRACIDVLYRNYVGYDQGITTISLVQGECLGGGFECALSSDILVAEKSARFGFPEILFNLFPGMGAYSFLERKVGQKTAEELLTSGQIYSADDMLQRGVVDHVVEDGQGEAGVAALIKKRARSRNGLAGIAQARRRVHRLDFAELLDIVTVWVDSALKLTSRDMKLMQKLVTRQNDLGVPRQLH
ncbi:MAG TPA: crotonase/enoyl-CoA hydratase family protein [Pelomicrobium sp.]|nr:crotonase/enoyl-CoA hydratase family protein [Pelomicrobium sp.]